MLTVEQKLKAFFEKEVAPKITQYRNQVAQVENELGKINQKVSDLRQKANAEQAKINELTSKVDSDVLADKDIHGTSTVIHTLQLRRNAYTASVAELENTVPRLTQKLAQLKHDLQSTLAKELGEFKEKINKEHVFGPYAEIIRTLRDWPALMSQLTLDMNIDTNTDALSNLLRVPLLHEATNVINRPPSINFQNWFDVQLDLMSWLDRYDKNGLRLPISGQSWL